MGTSSFYIMLINLTLLLLGSIDLITRRYFGFSLHLLLWGFPFLVAINNFKIRFASFKLTYLLGFLYPIYFVKSIFIGALRSPGLYLYRLSIVYLIFLIPLGVFFWGFTGEKQFLSWRVLYSLGPEGDPNYSFAAACIALLIIRSYSRLNLFFVFIIVLILLVVFWSRGVFLALFISFILYRLSFTSFRFLFFPILLLVILLPFSVVFFDRDYLITLSQFTSYRTDVWLFKLGLDPVLISATTAELKQSHNAAMQIYSYVGWLGLLMYILFIYLFYVHSNNFSKFIIAFVVIVGFSLNSFTSLYFILAVLFLYVDNFFSNSKVLKS